MARLGTDKCSLLNPAYSRYDGGDNCYQSLS